MKHSNFPLFRVFIPVAAAGLLGLSPAAAQQSPPAGDSTEDVEVLTRGPVHEAFAEAVSFEPQAGFIVSAKPPDPIEELPPEQQPAGDNVAWIAGYWAWDDDRKDFLWISGVWRNLPPGRQWVPGYWGELEDGGYQWTSGYWADSGVEEVEYISTPPPQSIDTGPSVAAPSDDHSWVPGNWRWVDTRYVWSPGYWLGLRANWTWVPSRYCWTRRGYVYVDGYWDHGIAHRGTLFAPVYYRRPVYAVPDYYYTPSIVVGLSVFSDHLFVRPRFSHYYFGDYYDPGYVGAGFYPAFRWHRHRHGYDPIFAHHRWHHRHDRGWDRQRGERYDFFRDNADARPPRTWAAMQRLGRDRFSDNPRVGNRAFASTLANYVSERGGDQRFRRLDQDRRKQLVAQRRQVRNFGQQRREIEARGISAARASEKIAVREKLRRSPLVGRQASELGRQAAPPRRPEARGSALSPERRADLTQRRAQRQQAARQATGRRQQATPQRGAQSRQQARQAAPQRRQQATPERGTPRPQARQAAPQRRQQATPQRGTPRPQARQATPQRRQQATPQRGTSRPQARQAAPQRRQQTTPQRGTPRPQARQAAPQRRQQATPQRGTPRPQARQATPQRRQQATPQRSTPRPQARQAAPQRRQQATPQRSTPRPQTRQAPQRRQQATPQRSAPRPQARQAAPQRRQQAAPQRSTPRPQARQAPQRRQQAAPQRSSQPRQQARQAAPQRRPQATRQSRAKNQEEQRRRR